MEQNFFFEYASSYKVHLSGTDKNLAQFILSLYDLGVWNLPPAPSVTVPTM